MIKNIIFGKRSNLTSSIIERINNHRVISSSKYNLAQLNLLNSGKNNYIFNNFYPSFKLNSLNHYDYENFLQLSLSDLVQILSNLKIKNINKIIYTSSASVYGIADNLKNFELDKYNRKVYAAFKYSSEKIIENFCRPNKIDFYIMRLFNTYGNANDNFSFIEKLINIKKNKLNLSLINNGMSFRDFIHLDDVALIYKKFLTKNYSSGVYDIGTGQGKLIKNIVEFVDIEPKKIINLDNINETTKSIANIKNLKKNLGNYKFKSLEDYFRKKLKIKTKKKSSLLN